MSHLLQTDLAVALVTLTAMEIVLGIDNIVFLTILVGKLPERQQPVARLIGLSLALLMRLALLFAISWIMGLKKDLFTVVSMGISGRDLILLAGGLFLIGKATHEIHDKLEVVHPREALRTSRRTFGLIILQIVLLDAVFSLDSVITAVGMVQSIPVIVVAMVIAVAVMLLFAKSIGAFVNRHPSMKILALSFLILIGVLLVAEGLEQHLNRGYIYFAMSFSLVVELLNMRYRKRHEPLALHHRFEAEPALLSTTDDR